MSGSRSALGPGREFDLIRVLTEGLVPGPGVVEGPGDDAAVLEGGWVVTCDLSIEGVHLRRDWLDAGEMGGRAVRAALSDIAAMAAEPVAVLLALAGSPADHQSGFLAAVGRGAREAVEAFGATLAGGDVTRSPGPLVIDVTALGRTAEPCLRRGARPGDELWVTGALGGAAAAVRLLEEGRPLDDTLRERLARPVPRLAEARRLGGTGRLRALLDLSDGLAGDAGHLAAASGVALELDPSTVPVDPAAARALGDRAAFELALHGGEDYELLFAADPAFAAEAGRLEAEMALPLTRVGRALAGRGVWLVSASGERREAGGGWDHFADDGRQGAGP
jgi:thiamine-monophosphate kinase